MRSDKHPGMVAVQESLAERGFRRRRSGILTLDLGDEVLGWVGLNTSGRAAAIGIVVVNPVMGVRHQELERVVAEFRGEKFHSYIPASYTSPLSAVDPKVRANDFILHNNANDPATVESLVSAVASTGRAFMEELADPNALLGKLQRRFLHQHSADLRYPMMLWLLGRNEEALEAISAGLADAEQREGPAAEELVPYLTRLRSAIEIHQAQG